MNRVALIHDWLTGRRGGEKVLEALVTLFPDADIFTLFHFKGSQSKIIEDKKIHWSFLQNFPFIKKFYRNYLPLYPIAIELFNLEKYDLIISSSHCVAKGIIPHPHSLHICYCHTPMRYAWDLYHYYFPQPSMSLFKKIFIPSIMNWLRTWDQATSLRVDYFISNSYHVAKRIKKYYGREAEVINPPVDTEFFTLYEEKEDYYLIVSALVPYKKIDLAISAFNRINKKLKIVGNGPDYKKLKKLAGKNVEFLGSVSDSDLKFFYQRAKCFLLPGEEDFGIAPLEAQACGTPVIAFRKGGATETILENETGIFFEKLNIESLISAIDKFEKIKFNFKKIRDWTLNFSYDKFLDRIRKSIDEKIEKFREK
ncbi:MAG: glycosyltransferase [Acidobacteriota bacterium]